MISVVHLDVPLIVGSGVAGLSVALGLEQCAIFTMARLANDGSSEHAQGGVAASVSDDDSPTSHAADTLSVSAGLGDIEAIRLLTEDGPQAIGRIIALGAKFDRNQKGALALGREAGHSTRRIVHAQGDATGREVMRVLGRATRERAGIQIFEEHSIVELVTVGGRVLGVVAAHPGGPTVYLAPVTILATGGIGQLYSRTTNPEHVKGDGLALAAHAGARLVDLEFVQFHPTALMCGHDPLPLLTEALRGEGAHLHNDGGERFMLGVHPDAELAPRDIVARAVFSELQNGGVWLDARSIGPQFPARFPTVFNIAASAGLDPRTDKLPVSAAAHYFMGGIDVDMNGRTSLEGLYAVGEVSSTGVHGANRLASNSLLEGFVFGSRIAQAVSQDTHPQSRLPSGYHPTEHENINIESELMELRQRMWNDVGIVRDADGLASTLRWLRDHSETLNKSAHGRNAATVSTLIAAAALAREESRGSHYRRDFPGCDPTQAIRRRVG